MFATKFTDHKIISKMSLVPQTPAAIAAAVGCSTITIIRALPRLEEEMMVEKITIESTNGRRITGWYTEYNDYLKRKRGRGL
jgi:hypothetical protein